MTTALNVAGHPVLEVADLHTHLHLRAGTIRAVDGVTFSLRAGETLGVVGESGCGKSMTALSILRLVPAPAARIVKGSVRLDGVELLDLPERQMRRIRGNEIAMIFQEPMTSLNPVVTIGRQIGEAIMLHQGLSERAARDKAGRDAGAGAHPRAAPPPRRLSAQPVGRHAPARDDRHGAVVQPQDSAGRRADDGARRDDPGADPQPHGRAAAEARHRDHPHHPRSRPHRRERRPRRRDVCRPDRRAGPLSTISSRSRAIPTPPGSSPRSPVSTHHQARRHQARPKRASG